GGLERSGLLPSSNEMDILLRSCPRFNSFHRPTTRQQLQNSSEEANAAKSVTTPTCPTLRNYRYFKPDKGLKKRESYVA
ncbi:15358_t:CDS:1, partial [Acaulospora colombiana]